MRSRSTIFVLWFFAAFVVMVMSAIGFVFEFIVPKQFHHTQAINQFSNAENDSLVIVFIAGIATSSIHGERFVGRGGSGFVYKSKRNNKQAIISAHHLMSNMQIQYIGIQHQGGQLVAARVLGVDVSKDLLVLQPTSRHHEFTHALSVGASLELKENGRVTVLGNPNMWCFKKSEGKFRRRVQHQEAWKFGINCELLMFQAPVETGCSGGPLLNSRGEVVGIVSMMTQQGEGLAIPIDLVEAEIEEILK